MITLSILFLTGVIPLENIFSKTTQTTTQTPQTTTQTPQTTTQTPQTTQTTPQIPQTTTQTPQTTTQTTTRTPQTTIQTTTQIPQTTLKCIINNIPDIPNFTPIQSNCIDCQYDLNCGNQCKNCINNKCITISDVSNGFIINNDIIKDGTPLNIGISGISNGRLIHIIIPDTKEYWAPNTYGGFSFENSTCNFNENYNKALAVKYIFNNNTIISSLIFRNANFNVDNRIPGWNGINSGYSTESIYIYLLRDNKIYLIMNVKPNRDIPDQQTFSFTTPVKLLQTDIIYVTLYGTLPQGYDLNVRSLYFI
jgi:hypothetical protein